MAMVDGHNSIAIVAVNSIPPLRTNSRAIYAVGMVKRRTPSEEQLADARRLEQAWLAFKRKRPEASQEWVAKQCGWKTQGAAHQYISGKIPLNLPALIKFAGLFGVSEEKISPKLALQLPARKDPGDTHVYLAKGGVKFVGGKGMQFVFVGEEREKSHAFRRDWLIKRRFKEDALKIIDIVGESMYPLIRDGDVVCVNTADREPKSGEIYAIATADGPRVKYMYRRESDGGWELRSENPSPRYAPEEITEGHQAAIVGRVVWRAGDI